MLTSTINMAGRVRQYISQSSPLSSSSLLCVDRASVIWPERNFCGDDSFFKCDDFKHLEMRKLGRMVANDAEVSQISGRVRR